MVGRVSTFTAENGAYMLTTYHSYFQSIEPPNGAAIPRILPEALLPFL
jgi:hypothetical protein